MFDKKLWEAQQVLNNTLLEERIVLNDRIALLEKQVKALLVTHHDPNMVNGVLKQDKMS